jgi:polyhydroxybutyrate depolymerase
MGGGLSNYAACFMADIYAAVVPGAFDLSEELIDGVGCHPVRPIPIMNFRGTRDGTVQYGGGYSDLVPGKALHFLGAQKNFTTWASINGCTGNPSKDSDGCDVYNTCNGGVKVGLCVDKGTSDCNGNDHNDPCPSIGWKFLKQLTLP